MVLIQYKNLHTIQKVVFQYVLQQTYKVEKGEQMKIIKISAEHQYKFVRNTTNIIINKYKLL